MLELPLWAVFPLTLLSILLSIEGGYLWARYKRAHASEEKEAPVGAMVGATLGLLAFLLAFSFGLAVDHGRLLAVGVNRISKLPVRQ